MNVEGSSLKSFVVGCHGDKAMHVQIEIKLTYERIYILVAESMSHYQVIHSL